ncbi:phosphoribosyl-AMP cyclohydrolase [Carboxydochorda subterranea]|uniref:Histidine biosynthesis bifunctional protein HisIE n=1 Tax=Carboxydichorda subterranea TaxID=3109565 RepID=A0ABZ1BUK0_9FIRM|nr:phosphoribosyl-AMP cyclohydrolase [Limnochorda sp. L945t]WRP16364.1 phosphoribosyl-AMP cyclohydrolase [Limnochorda sp. L945t]
MHAMRRLASLDDVRFGPDGLVPAVAVDEATGQVLMLAYMNRSALEATLRTGRATYFSRSRQSLWVKGETSGNRQDVRDVLLDCDGDAVLLVVEQHGQGACHLGEWSCFHRTFPVAVEPLPTGPAAAPEGGGVPTAAVLDALRSVIRQRHQDPQPGSYTASLLERGIDAPLKKLAEEAGEVILAAKDVDRLRSGGAGTQTAGGPEEARTARPGELARAYDALAWEAADLLYHLLVTLEAAGLPSEAVWRELARRRQKGGSH